jgi:hypothetical protein
MHIKFKTKKEAISHLKSNALDSVEWEGFTSIYWNGRIKSVLSDKKIKWT